MYLCKIDALPQHLQFNRYIQHGYRPLLDLKGCLKSTCALHNETFNIYSHVLGFFYFLLAVHDYQSLSPINRTIVLVFICTDFLCCTLPFALSVIYHTFMCHRGGEAVYRTLLKVDVAGVWVIATAGPLPLMYTALSCNDNLFYFYMTSYAAVSLFSLRCLLLVDSKRARLAVLSMQFVYRVMATVLRVFLLPSNDPRLQAVSALVATDFLSLVGACINAFHVPERWFPLGSPVYIFNGHSLMHVVGVVMLVVARRGFLLDMQWINAGGVCITK